jgi:hypothetical protein
VPRARGGGAKRPFNEQEKALSLEANRTFFSWKQTPSPIVWDALRIHLQVSQKCECSIPATRARQSQTSVHQWTRSTLIARDELLIWWREGGNAQKHGGREIDPSIGARVKSQPTIFGEAPQSTPIHPTYSTTDAKMLAGASRECWESSKSRRFAALFLDAPLTLPWPEPRHLRILHHCRLPLLPLRPSLFVGI